ncbi:PcfK-like family protein [Dysgonomonas sp. OttesenSCG-928-D17]|nr:PcfK-like family protein [Dysgonomonas sp. OttesenSCG-928-D17]
MPTENTVTDYFKVTIQSYLEQRAQTDELFAPVYAKPGKNIDDCITYILNYVKQSGICGFADDEIYSLALHYYDEDSIEAGKPINCNVVVNHAIVLTDAEKAQARQKAIQKVQDEAYAKMKQGQAKPKAKQSEANKIPNLFNF